MSTEPGQLQTALAWGLALYGEADLAGGLAGASEAALSGWGAAL